MKFVALALTVLLAAGCQARFLQADDPDTHSKLAHARTVVALYLDKLEKGLQDALKDEDMDADRKKQMSEGIGSVRTYIKSAADTVVPLAETYIGQADEFTKDLREKMNTDVENLKKELEPKVENLKDVLKKHLAQYRDIVNPLIEEYKEKHEENMAALRTKVEPVVADLRQKIEVNLEETKKSAAPIREKLEAKIKEYWESAKQIASPSFEEYRPYLLNAAANAQTEDVKKIVQSMVEDLKTKFEALWAALSKTEST